MDPRERLNDPFEALRVAMDGRMTRVWTAMPVIIDSFDASTMTCVLQPAIMGQIRAPDGTISDVPLPQLVDCPVVFPGGGGCALTFPVAAGDEGLCVIASRCIDAWWQQGDVQPQAELRMHDLSDGFVIPGVRSVPRVIPSYSTQYAELRTDSGNARVRLDPETGQITLISPVEVVVAAPGVAVNGYVHAAGEIIAGYDAVNSVDLQTHLHDETKPSIPGDHSGPPVPGT